MSCPRRRTANCALFRRRLWRRGVARRGLGALARFGLSSHRLLGFRHARKVFVLDPRHGVDEHDAILDRDLLAALHLVLLAILQLHRAALVAWGLDLFFRFDG